MHASVWNGQPVLVWSTSIAILLVVFIIFAVRLVDVRLAGRAARRAKQTRREVDWSEAISRLHGANGYVVEVEVVVAFGRRRTATAIAEQKMKVLAHGVNPPAFQRIDRDHVRRSQAAVQF